MQVHIAILIPISNKVPFRRGTIENGERRSGNLVPRKDTSRPKISSLAIFSCSMAGLRKLKETSQAGGATCEAREIYTSFTDG